MKRLLIVGGLVALVLAAVLSYYASSQPDGLNKVAEDYGIGANEQQSTAAESPLADYTFTGISDQRWGGATAGVVGVAVTAALGFGLFYLIRDRRH